LLLFSICLVAVAPLIVVCWLEAWTFGGELIFGACTQLLALIPSHLGVLLRSAFYFGTLKKTSWEISIGFGSLFTHRDAVVGANVSTGAYCVIGHADIGAGVMMGSRVSIPSGKRQRFGDAGEVVAEPRYDTVCIGSRSWIGEGAIVLAEVGAGCVVAAGAVVVTPMPQDHIVGGNPARPLK